MAGRNSTPATRKRTRTQIEEDPSTTKKRRVKESPTAEPEDDHQESKPTPKPIAPLRRGRSLRAAPAAKDTSDEKPVQQPKQAAPKAKATTQPKKTQAPANPQKTNVYDVPDSGEDEIAAAVVTPRSKCQKPGPAKAASEKAQPEPVVAAEGDEPPKKKRGRPSKKDREARVKAEKEASSREDVQESDGGVVTKEMPAQKTGRPKKAAGVKLAEEAQVPKGILTPRKNKNAEDRLRKNVAFDSMPDEEALDSLAAASPSKSARKRREAAEAVDEMQVGEPNDEEEGSEEGSDQDDEVCAICSKPDSEPPNEIVFCDACDMAVHQRCYGLAEIPEGDWICRNCSQEDATSAVGAAANQVPSSVVAREDQRPDIPNFDQHLHSAQRVLLDRCAGRRRIRLQGQVEAYEKAYQLVEQTVVAGEGNSMMVIGARGCGKTTVGCLVSVKLCQANCCYSWLSPLSPICRNNKRINSTLSG